jgi:succinate dehydrogenase (ubiquinone) cytochrome b560 subunit
MVNRKNGMTGSKLFVVVHGYPMNVDRYVFKVSSSSIVKFALNLNGIQPTVTLTIEMLRLAARRSHLIARFQSTAAAGDAKKLRPVSPHVSIYQPQLTWVMSIAHRVTGAGLAAGTFQL